MTQVLAPAARPSRTRTWWLAIRPATLPAAASGVLVGLGASLSTGAAFRVDVAIACLGVALLLQIAANLANDLSDFRRGADTPDRLGPTRVAASGYVTERQLEAGIGLVILAAGVLGLWLVSIGGLVVIALGGAAILAALAYTGGPWPYGYRGLGEPFVFVFFGLLAVGGTAYLEAGRLEPIHLIAAVPVGALVTAILVVNNLRDIPTDRAAGKRTLAVMLGAGFARAEYIACAGAAAVVPIALLVAALATAGAGGLGSATVGGGHVGPLILTPLLSLPLAVPLWRVIEEAGDPRRLNAVLKGTARLALAYGLLFALGLAAGSWPF